MSEQQKRRVSFYLDEDGEKALNTIKQYYGISSDSATTRRAIHEHARQITELTKREPSVTYSKRVF